MEQRVDKQQLAGQSHSTTATHTEHERIRTTLDGVYGLTLLDDVLAGEAAQAVLSLLQALTSTDASPAETALAYSRAFRELATAVQMETGTRFPHLSDAWQAYLLMRLSTTRNLWSSQIERAGTLKVAPALRAQAQRDLRALQRLFQLDAQLLWQVTCASVTPYMPALREAWSPWYDLASQSDEQTPDALTELAYQAVTAQDWADLVPALEEYWSRYGTGPLASYQVLRWLGDVQQFVGVAHPDPVRLSNLVGHERQQDRLTANIERFLAALPVHDILLYGPPGTGKSSTIKALVNAYSEQGLRLVEVRKENIGDLPQVVAALRGRAPRYLLFIDDLSFEEHETEYKVLKVLLEGTVEARPANVLICATTNRLNLVRENFAERGKPSGDVNWRDTMDEKQSLVHRFGLRITFISPDQQQYLHIVSELARQRQLDLDAEQLQTRALQWERQHAGRSGRVARQFVDELEADLKFVAHE